MKSRYIEQGSIAWAAGNRNFTQSKCNGTSASGVIHYDAGGASINTLEEMIDSTNGKSRVNPCKHYKKNTVVLHTGANQLFGYAIDGTDRGIAEIDFPEDLTVHKGIFLSFIDTWNGSSFGKVPPYGFSISAANKSHEALVEDCYEKARQLKADVVLNIAEANQIIPAIKSLAACLPQMARNWSSIRKLVRSASGSYLAWKFGISPLLQDASAIWKYTPSLIRDLKRHNSGMKSRYSAIAQHPTSLSSSNHVHQSIDAFPVQIWRNQGEVLAPPVTRYVLVVEPNVKGMSEIEKSASFMLSRFGTGPASFAWEKVPYSFVVDWFLDLRGLLRLLDDAIMAPPYKVIGFSRSFGYHIDTSVNLRRFSPCGGSEIMSTDCGYIRHKLYERSVVPLGYSAPHWNNHFGKNQAGITAALIAQKLSGSKRK